MPTRASHERPSKRLMVSALLVVMIVVGCRPQDIAGPASGSNDLGPNVAAASGGSPACPTGWSARIASKGVSLCYRQIRRGGLTADDYLVQLDLRAGARLLQISEPQSVASTSNPSPIFPRRYLSSWWSRYTSVARLTCMVNGSFFTDENPITSTTEMSFPLKGEGNLYSRGADYRSGLTKRTLKVDGTEAWIESYSLQTSSFSTVKSELSDARLAVVGATRYISGTERTGRNFAAVRDLDNDGNGETVVFLISSRASPDDMNNILSDLRVKSAMSFDGGGSAGIKCNDGSGFGSEVIRSIPQVFAIIKSP